jgi:hypothetical protein
MLQTDDVYMSKGQNADTKVAEAFAKQARDQLRAEAIAYLANKTGPASAGTIASTTGNAKTAKLEGIKSQIEQALVAPDFITARIREIIVDDSAGRLIVTIHSGRPRMLQDTDGTPMKALVDAVQKITNSDVEIKIEATAN